MKAIDPIRALYGSKTTYREMLAAHEREVLAASYPPHVQEALDFIERETAAYERRDQQLMADQRQTDQRRAVWRVEARARRLDRTRVADADAKFWEVRRKQRAAQEAKRRFQPAQPEGWVKP
jgi:hypothetical protein